MMTAIKYIFKIWSKNTTFKMNDHSLTAKNSYCKYDALSTNLCVSSVANLQGMDPKMSLPEMSSTHNFTRRFIVFSSIAANSVQPWGLIVSLH